MSDKQTFDEKHSQHKCYEIRLKGHLDDRWAEWFEGLNIMREDNGETLISGQVIDQAALHGLLKKVRDLCLPLVSVNPVEPSPSTAIGVGQADQADLIQSNSSVSFNKRRAKMNANSKTIETKDRKFILSTLWIFVMFNYLYADVFTLFFNPAAHTETLPMPQGAVLAFAFMMETAIAMVLLSRLLKYGANRWANMIAAIFHTALVAWTLTGAAQPPFYVMFASIEIGCTLFITWYAWKWRNPEGQPVILSALAN